MCQNVFHIWDNRERRLVQKWQEHFAFQRAKLWRVFDMGTPRALPGSHLNSEIPLLNRSTCADLSPSRSCIYIGTNYVIYMWQ